MRAGGQACGPRQGAGLRDGGINGACDLGGLPQEASALTINRFCSSGLQAIALAAGAIALGTNDIAIAGGVESMSMVPMTGNKLSASPEAMAKYASVYTPMGITAENVAKKFSISRADQDAFALKSQQKAAAAQQAKKFDDEIVPVNAVRFDGNNLEPSLEIVGGVVAIVEADVKNQTPTVRHPLILLSGVCEL